MQPQLYIDAVLKLESQNRKYDHINQLLMKVQDDIDFSTRINPIDNLLEDVIVKALDDILFSLTGFAQMATYYLYEKPTGGHIIGTDGVEYQWKDGMEFQEVIYKMIKSKVKE